VPVRDGFLHAPEAVGIGCELRPEVRDRSDAVIRVSDEPWEAWLTSRNRYTYPPPDIQEMLDARRRGARDE
jgi:hypothetical protein